MSYRVVTSFVIMLSAAVVLSGCIPIDVEKSIMFSSDGSGSMTVDVSTPSSPLAQDAFQSIAKQLPSWANASIFGREYATHLFLSFGFRDIRDLNGKLSQLAEILSYDEEVQFMPETRHTLLKRGYRFKAYLSPRRSSSGFDMPPDLTTRYSVSMPGRITYSNSPSGINAPWEIHGVRKATLSAESAETVPLTAELTLKLMPFWSNAELDVIAADDTFRSYPWARADWDAYKKLMRKKLAFMACRAVKKTPTARGGVTLSGLRFSARFRDLASLAAKAGLKSAADSSSCRTKVTKKGFFRSIYTYDIIIPPTRGTALEGILDYGTLKVQVPGQITFTNTAGRDSKDPGMLKWDLSLARPSSIQFVYQRTAWELIIPIIAAGVAVPVCIIAALQRRRRTRKISGLETDSSDFGGEEE
ncbi:MAG: hypothetical protein M1305_07250 [Candidatus Marsarchaeota archaeon]|nr:hypothetical protein [Candidatus Marsarchaeota archaeon]